MTRLERKVLDGAGAGVDHPCSRAQKLHAGGKAASLSSGKFWLDIADLHFCWQVPFVDHFSYGSYGPDRVAVWGGRCPRLLRLPDGDTRTHGPLFLSERRPVPARRPAAADICPHTGRARLGYDRARSPVGHLRRARPAPAAHSAATHLGEAEVPLQLIMGKARHKNPRTAMRYVKPGAEAIAKVTEVLAPRRRTH